LSVSSPFQWLSKAIQVRKQSHSSQGAQQKELMFSWTCLMGNELHSCWGFPAGATLVTVLGFPSNYRLDELVARRMYRVCAQLCEHIVDGSVGCSSAAATLRAEARSLMTDWWCFFAS